MNNDEPFLHTLKDLEEHTAPGASEYEVLMSSGLLRKLLLDGGQSVVDQVNRRRHLPITFWINEPGEYENKIVSDGPVSWALTDGLDPNTALVTGNSVAVNRDRFMGRRDGRQQGHRVLGGRCHPSYGERQRWHPRGRGEKGASQGAWPACTNCGNQIDVSSVESLSPCAKCGNGEWNTVSGGDSADDPHADR